jgi:hypothetical protein
LENGDFLLLLLSTAGMKGTNWALWNAALVANALPASKMTWPVAGSMFTNSCLVFRSE